MFRELRNIFDTAETQNLWSTHATVPRQRIEMITGRLVAPWLILSLTTVSERSCSFLSFLVCAFHLDKHRDAKRFFGPMSRDF